MPLLGQAAAVGACQRAGVGDVVAVRVDDHRGRAVGDPGTVILGHDGIILQFASGEGDRAAIAERAIPCPVIESGFQRAVGDDGSAGVGISAVEGRGAVTAMHDIPGTGNDCTVEVAALGDERSAAPVDHEICTAADRNRTGIQLTCRSVVTQHQRAIGDRGGASVDVVSGQDQFAITGLIDPITGRAVIGEDFTDGQGGPSCRIDLHCGAVEIEVCRCSICDENGSFLDENRGKNCCVIIRDDRDISNTIDASGKTRCAAADAGIIPVASG